MQIYTILVEMPDLWQGEKINRAGIAKKAHDYIWELLKMESNVREQAFWHDINKLIEAYSFAWDVYSIRSTLKDTESANENKKKIDAVQILLQCILRYLREYGITFPGDTAEIDSLYTSYEGALSFLPYEEWPIVRTSPEEDFKGININSTDVKSKWPRSLKEETAKDIWQRLTDKKLIECKEKDFIWYFCKCDENEMPQPPKIKWALKEEKGEQTNFAFLCMCLQERKENAKYRPENKVTVRWRMFLSTFNVEYTSEQLKQRKKEISTESYPSKRDEIIYCVWGIED